MCVLMPPRTTQLRPASHRPVARSVFWIFGIPPKLWYTQPLQYSEMYSGYIQRALTLNAIYPCRCGEWLYSAFEICFNSVRSRSVRAAVLCARNMGEITAYFPTAVRGTASRSFSHSSAKEQGKAAKVHEQARGSVLKPWALKEALIRGQLRWFDLS